MKLLPLGSIIPRQDSQILLPMSVETMVHSDGTALRMVGMEPARARLLPLELLLVRFVTFESPISEFYNVADAKEDLMVIFQQSLDSTALGFEAF